MASPGFGELWYGFELGVGFRTKVANVSPFLLAVVLLYAATLTAAFAVATGWAVGRSLSLLGRYPAAPALKVTAIARGRIATLVGTIGTLLYLL